MDVLEVTTLSYGSVHGTSQLPAQADLHLHSDNSDGTFPTEVIVRMAKGFGLRAISITDHDSVNGVEEALRVGSDLDVEVVPGVELSTIVEGKDIHILGYFIDCQNQNISNYLRIFREERRSRAERMVAKLNDMGVRIRMESVLRKAGSGSIGRPHIADAMVEGGFVFTVTEAFQRYIGYDAPAYEDKYRISPREAIDLIKSAGGVAMLAHPGTYSKDEILPDLIKNGLDGIEVVHPKHSQERTLRYHEMARRLGLLEAGGSDCHGDRKGQAPSIGRSSVPYHFVENMRKALP